MERRSMDYSRRDFLRISAAGLPLVAGGALFTSTALGSEGARKKANDEKRAAIIHRDSMEEAIREAGEDPEEVRQQVRDEMLKLKGKAIDNLSF